MGVTRDDIERALGHCEQVERVGSPSGVGECWRVSRDGEVLACKVIIKAGEPERFQREVAALERLQSPRVVRVLGKGELTTADDGREHPYLLSEFVDGGDVRQNLVANGPPDDASLRAFLMAVLDGLEALHAADIVHRDLKPENVILRGAQWEDPVIIDLGLSRLVDLSSVTVYPWAGGTWPYMAPEQLRAERATVRTDLWAIAVIAGELAMGTHPFWRGEASPPADWETRLQSGVGIPDSRPAGLQKWVSETGSYAGYRRPTAARARRRLQELWP